METESAVEEPLVGGEQAERIWRWIDDIAQGLLEVDPLDPPSTLTRTDGLAAEMALFFAYLAEARQDEAMVDAALDRLAVGIDRLHAGPLRPALHGGYCGIAWTLQHLDGRIFDLEDEGLDGVDDALLTLLHGRPQPWDYDLINGLAGFAVYALERLPRERARRVLERIVDLLDAASESVDGGRKWHTPPDFLTPTQRESCPDGFDNLGVAHGMPGVLVALAGIHAAGIEAPRIERLLGPTIDWILAQQRRGRLLGPQGEGAEVDYFPSWIGGGAEAYPSRLGWCYGDIGVATALLATARCLGRQDWQDEALRIAHRSARRDTLEAATIFDAGLCHGSLGLSHQFQRFYRATGDPAMAAAARHWLGQTHGLYRDGDGVAGFPAWSPLNGGWVPDAGFLGGSAGVGLALLATVTTIEPAWDRLLLMSPLLSSPPQERPPAPNDAPTDAPGSTA